MAVTWTGGLRLKRAGECICPLCEAIFRHIYFFGEYEERTAQLMRRVVRPGQVWADVGANIGVVTIVLADLVGPQGYIHAFEPNPEMLRHLRLTLGQPGYGNVRLYECALGSSDGTVDMFLPAIIDAVEGGSGRGSIVAHRDIRDRAVVQVPLHKLDDLLAGESRRIDGLKLDVEGYEAEVLDGACKLFKERPPAVIFSEVVHFPDALLKPKELVAKFIELSYIPFRTEPFKRYHLNEDLHGWHDANMIFLHSDSVDEMADLLRDKV